MTANVAAVLGDGVRKNFCNAFLRFGIDYDATSNEGGQQKTSSKSIQSGVFLIGHKIISRS